MELAELVVEASVAVERLAVSLAPHTAVRAVERVRLEPVTLSGAALVGPALDTQLVVAAASCRERPGASVQRFPCCVRATS